MKVRPFTKRACIQTALEAYDGYHGCVYSGPTFKDTSGKHELDAFALILDL